MNLFSEAEHWQVEICHTHDKQSLQLQIQVNERATFTQYLSERMCTFENVLVSSYEKRYFYFIEFRFSIEPSIYTMNRSTLWVLPMTINEPINIPLRKKEIQKHKHLYIEQIKEDLTEQIEQWLQMEHQNFVNIENCMLQ